MICLPFTLVLLQSKTVAILPVGDKSGDRDSAYVKKAEESTREYIVDKFKASHWDVRSLQDVDAAIGKQNFDPNDREYWTTKNLIELGRKFKTDYIVFAVVTETFNGSSNAFFDYGGGVTGAANVKVWLVDVAHATPILKGVVSEGKSTSNAFGNFTGSHGRIIRGIQIALDKALDDPLKKLN